MTLTVIVRGRLLSFEVSNNEDIEEYQYRVGAYHNVTHVTMNARSGYYLSDHGEDCIVGHWVVSD